MVDFGGVADNAFRFAGWFFIPQYATNFLFPYVCRFLLRKPIPPPGSTQYQKVRRWTYAGVIFVYLGYTLFQAAYSQDRNFYEILQVDFNAGEPELKTAYRNLSKRIHPDKVGGQNDLFMVAREAYETLKDPVKRYAYDR